LWYCPVFDGPLPAAEPCGCGAEFPLRGGGRVCAADGIAGTAGLDRSSPVATSQFPGVLIAR